jgi:PPM family protein phosphatase
MDRSSAGSFHAGGTQMARPIGTIGKGSDVGKIRSENQDSFEVRELPEATLLVVADGMGGHRGGKLASRICVDTIVKDVEISDIQWNDPHQIRSVLEQTLLRANTEVYRAARQNEDAYNMGTTAVVAVLVGNQAHVAHVGDSRLYLLREGRAIRLTTDHTAAQFLVDTGQISAEEAPGHRDSHRLMRAIGIVPQVEPDLLEEAQTLQQHDTLLLCSDGLYDVVKGKEMAMAAAKFDPQTAVDKLIGLALDRGGPDNVTVLTYRRDDSDGVFTRLGEFMRREERGLPVYVWAVAAGALVLVTTFLTLALT